jgi:hypothetical protein
MEYTMDMENGVWDIAENIRKQKVEKKERLALISIRHRTLYNNYIYKSQKNHPCCSNLVLSLLSAVAVNGMLEYVEPAFMLKRFAFALLLRIAPLIRW